MHKNKINSVSTLITIFFNDVTYKMYFILYRKDIGKTQKLRKKIYFRTLSGSTCISWDGSVNRAAILGNHVAAVDPKGNVRISTSPTS